MNRNVLFSLLFLLIFSGCSYIPFFSNAKKETVADEVIYANKVVLSKRDALKIAQDFLRGQGLDQEFVVKSPSKVKKILLKEQNPRWAFEVYFESRVDANWKFWKTSPLMVQVDAEGGQVINWGRR